MWETTNSSDRMPVRPEGNNAILTFPRFRRVLQNDCCKSEVIFAEGFYIILIVAVDAIIYRS